MADVNEDDVLDLSRERSQADRVARAEELAHERDERARNLDDVREIRARELAIDVALRNQKVDARLAEDRQRLDKINGSIDKFNASLAQQDKRMEAIERAFGEFAAISKALADKGVSTRTFVLGVIAVLVPVIVLFLSSGKHP